MRILVVEDEKRLAQNLQELLRREGYTVDVSNDGVSGFDNALSGIYDLLVLDVMLPGLDGFALLRRLRSTGSTDSFTVYIGLAYEDGYFAMYNDVPAIFKVSAATAQALLDLLTLGA